MIKKGTWVRVKRVVLDANERSSSLPDDTKEVDLVMWVKGYLDQDAKLNDNVSIKTIIGRSEKGILIEANPSYQHNYGEFVPEILEISRIIKKTLYGDDYE